MGGHGDGERHRVLLQNALGADEFLRVTWHEGRQLVVFSHWQEGLCVAATPVRVSDIAELAELTVSALASELRREQLGWGPPSASEVVATGFELEEPA